ncbi:RNA polymerase sigma factor [Devosia sp. A16]|uniref:RNA polymerase sigma factor n=1 Tax=Devosia sp. A16 TaxID=1736675 RepID=UPI000A5B65B6
MSAHDTHRAIEATFRIERARLVAGLVRLVRSIDRAEELAQDALVIALDSWPKTGVPANPGAWLMTTARRRAIDAIRHERMRLRKHPELVHALDQAPDDAAAAIDAALSDDLGDELLGLIFAACHPMLSADARAALTLRVVGGLSIDEIARAFLANEAAIAKRIVRAKQAIATAGLGFEVPRGAERAARLPSVLEVIYLIFNEGYAATAGDDPIRPGLCLEALRLGRVLAGLLADDPEVFGLVALMEFHASRLPARIGPDGALVPLPDQDRTRWDQLLIRRGLDALARAEALGPTAGGWGPYVLQAALAACHVRARTAAETDWSRIAGLYDRLRLMTPSPVVVSIAPSLMAWPLVQRLASASSSSWPTNRRSATTPHCRRRAATCCSAPAGSRRPAPHSRPPHG